MQHSSIKNVFLAGLTLMSFGFLSAQFVIPNVNNALQVIQRVLVTTNGMLSGSVVMDTNTGTNRIYINPSFLTTTGAYSGNYFLTLDSNGYLSFASGAVGVTGAQGATGTAGDTPYIGGNGNWFIGATDLGITAQGPAGATGDQGPAGPGITVGNGLLAGPASHITFLGAGVSVSNVGTDWTVSIPGGGGGAIGPWIYNDSVNPSNAGVELMNWNNAAVGQYSLAGGYGNTAGGDGSVVVGGSGNQTLGMLGFVGGGLMNTNDSDAGFIGGGANNTIDNGGVDVIVGGGNNTIDGDGFNFIGGGKRNSLIGAESLIVGGGDNTLSGEFSIIVGGVGNEVAGNLATIVGGGEGGFNTDDFFDPGIGILAIAGNYTNTPWSFIGGGGGNRIENTIGVATGGIAEIILGGLMNTINDSPFSFIGQGLGNTILTSAGSYIGFGAGSTIEQSLGSFMGYSVGSTITNSEASAIIFGLDNIIQGGVRDSVIVAGQDQTISGDVHFGFIGGGRQNIIDYASRGGNNLEDAFLGGGNSNTISEGDGTVLVGGRHNSLKGEVSFIGGGEANSIDGKLSSIVGGGFGDVILYNTTFNLLGNNIAGRFSFIGGGGNNSIRGHLNAIVGGALNVIGDSNQNRDMNFIGGGIQNRIEAESSSIVGGENNRIFGNRSFIGGGGGQLGNQIFGNLSSIVGGDDNIVWGVASFIGGGQSNRIYDAYSSIAGGSENVIYGDNSSIGGGIRNSITGNGSTIPGGSNNIVNGDFSMSIGQNSVANHNNAFIRNGYNVPNSTTLDGQFLIFAPGKVWINTNNILVSNLAELIVNGTINAVLPAYDDDSNAGSNGLLPGDLYQTSASNSLGLPAGVVMIKQ